MNTSISGKLIYMGVVMIIVLGMSGSEISQVEPLGERDIPIGILAEVNC